jgi:hypothetical protein
VKTLPSNTVFGPNFPLSSDWVINGWSLYRWNALLGIAVRVGGRFRRLCLAPGRPFLIQDPEEAGPIMDAFSLSSGGRKKRHVRR